MASGVGALRDRVLIQYDAAVSDGRGGETITPTTLATVWGAVRALSGNELLAAQAVNALTSYEVEIQYRTDVTEKMRLIWTPYLGTARTLEIHAVALKDGLPERVLLSCGSVS